MPVIWLKISEPFSKSLRRPSGIEYSSEIGNPSSPASEPKLCHDLKISPSTVNTPPFGEV